MAISGGGVSVTVSLDDQLSGGLMRANANVDSFTSNINRMIRGVEAARGTIAIFRGDIESATVALAAFGATAAVSGAVAATFVNAAQQASEYQKQVQLIQNNTLLTDQATKQMSASIMQMTSQTGSTLKDLGDGFMRISNFGNDAADATTILAEANKSAVESGSKVVDVANAGAAVMHEYGAAIGQTSDYFNTLAEAAKLGNSTQQEFVEGSSRSIAVAANLGVSFQDVSSAMVAMTRHGFDLATANTQVASIMQHIVDPSTAARAEIEKLSKATGVDLVYDFSLAGLQAKGLIGVMDDLRSAVGNNKDEVFKLIPALRGGQGALVLSGVGNQDMHQAENDLANTMLGLNKPVEDGFERMNKTASQQFAILRANVTKDAIEIGQGLMNLAGPMASVLSAPGVNANVPGVVESLGVLAAAKFASGGAGVLGRIGQPSDAEMKAALDAEQKRQDIIEKGRQAQVTADTEISASRLKADNAILQADSDLNAARQKYADEESARIAKLLAQTIAAEQAKAEAAAISLERTNAARMISQDFAHQALDLRFAQQDYRTGAGKLSTADERALQHKELSQRQELVNAQADEVQASNASFLPRYQALEQAKTDAQIDTIHAESSRLIKAAEADATKTSFAIADAQLAAQSASQVKLGNQLLANDVAMAGIGGTSIKRGASASAINAGLTQEVESAGFGSKIAGGASAVGGFLNEIIWPVTIALLIKQWVVDPASSKLSDHIVNADIANDPLAKGRSSDISTLNQVASVDTSRVPDQANAFIDYYQNEIIRLKGIENDLKSGFGGGVKDFIGLNDPSKKYIEGEINQYQAAIEYMQKQSQFFQSTSSQTPGGTGGLYGNLTDKGAGILSNQLLDQVSGGMKTAQEANKVWDDLAATYGRFIPGISDLTDQFHKNTQAIKDQKDAAAELLATQREEATKDLALGVPLETVSRAVLGTTLSGSDATKEQQAQAKRDIQDISKGWSDALGAVDKINTSNGLKGLSDAADALQKAGDELSRFGLSSGPLSDVTGLADAFKALADSETAAKSEMEGYMLVLNQTSGYLKEIENVRQGFNSAVSDAQTRALAGTANSSDLALIAQRTSVNTSLNQQQNVLGQRQSSDWLNITAALPNWERLDQISRDVIDSFGGGKVLEARITADVTEAQNAINQMINHPYQLKLTADLAQLFHDILPGSWIDNLFHGGGSSGDGSSVGVPSGVTSGGTMTANGDATILQKYGQSIKNYATQDQIDPALIGAIIMEESGGKAGIPNSTGSGATGLMQVMPGQGYDMSRLSGTDAASADYQIYAGTDLLKKKLAAYGGDMRQALTSYGFGVGSNHSIDQLTEGYLTQSRNALSGTGASEDGGGGGTDAASSAIRNQIVAKALSQVNQDKLVGYCEQWVEDTIQSVLGNRGPAYGAGSAGSAKTALGYYQSQGMVRPQGQEPQPGDLVYYGSGADGHVAIYVGGGKQASTWDHGPQTGTNRLIHVEQVGDGAHYVGIPGTGYAPDTGGPAITTYPGSQQAGTFNAQRPSNYRQPTLAELDAATKSTSSSANSAINNLDTQSAINVRQGLQSALPGLEQYYAIMSKIPAILQNSNDKFTFQEQALAESNQLAADQATYMYDVQNNTGNVADDITKMNTDAGELASYVKAQADDWLNIASATATIKKDQEDMTNLNNTHQATLDTQKIQDESLARGKQVQQWTKELSDQSQQLMHQSVQQSWQVDANSLQDRKTKEQRKYEDASITSDRNNVLATRQLTDQITALTRLQQKQDSGNTATEQSLSAIASGPGTYDQKIKYGELLAIQKDYDSRNKQNEVDQLNNLKDTQLIQQRGYEDQKYNLDQAHLIATRNFEDEATKADLNHQRIQLQWQQTADQEWMLNFNRQKSDTEAAWRLQDKRNNEEQIYQLDKASLDLKTKNDQQTLDDYKLIQQYNDGIYADWTKTLPLVQQAADIQTAAAKAVIGSDVSGAGTGKGSISAHAAGGMITTPYALVGENGPEIISAMGYYVSPNRGTGGGGGGSTVNMNFYGDTGLSDSDIADIKAYVDTKITAAQTRVAGNYGKARGSF